jgi:hypothetical protein
MLPEKAKLGVLCFFLSVCLVSVLNSYKTFQMGPRDLPVLQPQVKRFCKGVHKALNKCLDRHDKEKHPTDYCEDVSRQSSQCGTAVKEAYRFINMAGCPHQLRDVTLCELERCGGYHGSNHDPFSQEGCITHCDQVRKTLETCINEGVNIYFEKYGIQRSGHPQQ